MVVVGAVTFRLTRPEPETAPVASVFSSALRPKPNYATTPLSGTAATSREGLAATVELMTVVLAQTPANSAAAVRLADALLRQARVLNHAGLPLRAEAALDRVIEMNPSDYNARFMRAMVYLAQHRFDDALREAERCRSIRQDDPSIDAIITDASIELGDHATAFTALDRMMAKRPDAAAYARASYARELQGDFQGAIVLMSMAGSATSAHDPEAQAWHAAQLGHLHLTVGDVAAARREFSRSDALFPDYPLSATGLARVDIAMARSGDALARLAPRLATAPSAEAFELAGDAHTQLGDEEQAERMYRLAEAMWTSDTPDPAELARFRARRAQAQAGR